MKKRNKEEEMMHKLSKKNEKKQDFFSWDTTFIIFALMTATIAMAQPQQTRQVQSFSLEERQKW